MKTRISPMKSHNIGSTSQMWRFDHSLKILNPNAKMAAFWVKGRHLWTLKAPIQPEGSYSTGIMPGIILVFRWYMTHSEPTISMPTISTVKTKAALFHIWLDEVFMCRKK